MINFLIPLASLICASKASLNFSYTRGTLTSCVGLTSYISTIVSLGSDVHVYTSKVSLSVPFNASGWAKLITNPVKLGVIMSAICPAM